MIFLPIFRSRCLKKEAAIAKKCFKYLHYEPDTWLCNCDRKLKIKSKGTGCCNIYAHTKMHDNAKTGGYSSRRKIIDSPGAEKYQTNQSAKRSINHGELQFFFSAD